MDPAAFAVNYVVDKLVQKIEKQFYSQVIERWTRYRAHIFFNTFCASLLELNKSDADISKMLDSIMLDPKKSEVLFESYRSVCLSRSKDIGPRIIALLTAEIITINSTPTDNDYLIFSAAEELLDIEFNNFYAYMKQHTNENGKSFEETTIIIFEDETDSNWDSNISIGALNLAEFLGSWAQKLKGLGIIVDNVSEKQWSYDVDTDRKIDMPGITRKITWSLTLTEPSLRLADLVSRVQKTVT